MKPILIIPIELYFQLNISNYRFVLRVGDVDQIQKALEIAKDNDQCISILCELNNIEVVTLLNMNIKPTINLYINCTFNGDMLSLIKSLKPLENQELTPIITYLFSAETPNLVTLLKILSSCGYKSGVKLDCENVIDKYTFIELATYSYLSPVPHAQIEPFGFIQQEIHDKRVKYVDLNKFYFCAPDTFAHICIDGGVYLEGEFSESQKQLCNSVEALSQINYSDISMEYKKLRFYNHFDAEDECSKCSNFKICAGFYKKHFEDCKETMSIIHEMLF